VLNSILCHDHWWRFPVWEEADFDLPIHVKKVPRLNFVVASELICDDIRPTWDMVTRLLLHDEILLDVACLDQSVLQTTPLVADIAPADIPALLWAGLIEEHTGPDPVRNYCRVFTVNELHKYRRRLIIWPRAINDYFSEPGYIELPSMVQIREGLMGCAFAATFDFSVFYNQFELPENLRTFYAFKTSDGKTYKLRVIATGQRHCPAMAQALASSIAQHVRTRVPNSVVFAYIDNFCIAGATPEIVDMASNIFLDICRDCGITVEVEQQTSSCVTYLGVVYNLSGDTARDPTMELTDKTKAKLLSGINTFAAAAFPQPGVPAFTCPIDKVLSMFGVVVWAARILRFPLANLYTSMKFLRRISNADLPTSALCNPWPCALKNLCTCAELLRRHPPAPFPLSAATASWTLFSDACLSGYGAVLCAGSDINIISGRFSDVEDIQILETRALLYAVQALPFQESTKQPICIVVDNTSLQGGINKTWHRNFVVNSSILAIFRLLETKGYSLVSCTYIRSSENPADPPSRLYEF